MISDEIFSIPPSADMFSSSLPQAHDGRTKAGSPGSVDVMDICCQKQGSLLRQNRFSTLETLSNFLQSAEGSTFDSRIFLLSQRSSWRPLNVSMDMFQAIVNHHGIISHIYSLLSYFKTRNVGDGFCSPVRTKSTNDSMEICYSYKYAEKKEGDYPWVIRQTGIYHQYRLGSMQSVWIIVNPTFESLAEGRIKAQLQNDTGRDRIMTNALIMHLHIISTYLSNWKDYCDHFELSLEDIASDAATSDLESEQHVNHGSLVDLNSIIKRFLPLRAIFTSINLVLQTLSNMNDSAPFNALLPNDNDRIIANLDSEVLAHMENTKCLLDFAQNTRDHIADHLNLRNDTLNLRNQDVLQKQSHSLFELARSSARDSVAIRVITFLTLGYLPFSFVATVMGMNFFALDSSTSQVIVSSQLWIYFCVSLPLTALTLLLWRWNTRRDLRDTAESLRDEEQIICERKDSVISRRQDEQE